MSLVVERTPQPEAITVVLWPRGREFWRRVPQMFLGLVLLAVAVTISIRAGLGVAPWEVLHQGLSDRIGLSFGTTAILVGFAVLALWIPLREKPGVGTVANMVLVGLIIDVMLPWVSTPSALAWRVAMLAGAVVLFGIALGLYIGAGLGAGPRDGLMTGMATRGFPVWLVRTMLELVVLGFGYLLGGSVGVGTVVLAFGVGPAAHVALRVFHRRAPLTEPTGVGATGE